METALRPAPLSDPRRIARAACWVLIAPAALTLAITAAWAIEHGSWGRAGAPMLASGGVCLLGLALMACTPTRPPDVLFLRSFRSDRREHRTKFLADLALMPGLRVAGIRPPRRRLPLVLRLPLMPLFVLLYAKSWYLDLEAGRDWPVRLWRSLGDARAVIIDVRDVTEFVGLEIRLAVRSMGAHRCLFLVDGTRSEAEWRRVLASRLGEDAPAFDLHLAVLDGPGARDDAAVVRRFQEFAQAMPRGTAGLDPSSEPLVAAYARRRGRVVGDALLAGASITVAALTLGYLMAPGGLERGSWRAAAAAAVWGCGAAWFAVMVPVHLIAIERTRRAARVLSPAYAGALRARTTLVGIVLVLAAAAVAGSVVRTIVAVADDVAKARVAFVHQQMRSLDSALGIHLLHEGRYPESLEALTQGEAPELVALPLDPWDRPYRYRLVNRRTYVLGSDGPDRVEGTGDDIHPMDRKGGP